MARPCPSSSTFSELGSERTFPPPWLISQTRGKHLPHLEVRVLSLFCCRLGLPVFLLWSLSSAVLGSRSGFSLVFYFGGDPNGLLPLCWV